MKKFGLISEIEIDRKETWENRIFITLDIDWASDDVIEYVYNFLVTAGIPATWFLTHLSNWNAKIISHDRFETGIHPNFNKLLNGDASNGKNVNEVLDNCFLLSPKARSIRSHTLLQSSPLLETFLKRNLKYDLNTLIPISSGINVKPYKHCTGIIQLPHIWEDDVHCMYKWDYSKILNSILSYQGIIILDFHPIHIFLNTENLKRYEESRLYHHDFKGLSKYKYDGYGTESFLKQLSEVFEKNVTS